MRYQDTIRYPLPRAGLMPFFTDPDFFVRKYVQQGASNVKVLAAGTRDGRFSITVSRDVPVQVPIPSFARALVPAHITLVQTDSWDLAALTGRLEIEFKGMPVRLACDMVLADTPAGAVETLSFDIRVNVPLLGGKLEALLAQDLRLKFQHDTEVSLAIMQAAAKPA